MKRLLALAASAIAGAAATVLFAAPAQAHHPIISGKAVCQADGQWKITWTVANGDWIKYGNPYMRIDKVVQTPAGSPITGKIAKDEWLDPKQIVFGEQTVPGDTRKATLYIDAYWYKTRGGTDPRVHKAETGEVTPKGVCKPEEKPTATFTDECDGTVNVHLANPTDRMKTFKITAGNFTKDNISVAAGGETDVSVPAGSGKAKVEVKSGESKWVLVAEDDGWVLPASCAPPTATGYSDCTRFDIILNNPQGNLPVKAKIVYGTVTEDDITVAAGATKTFEFELNGAPEATVTIGGKTTIIKYEKPAACDTLPKTGMDTTTMIASGGGLAALGAVVFFFARRRMVQLRRMAA